MCSFWKLCKVVGLTFKQLFCKQGDPRSYHFRSTWFWFGAFLVIQFVRDAWKGYKNSKIQPPTLIWRFGAGPIVENLELQVGITAFFEHVTLTCILNGSKQFIKIWNYNRLLPSLSHLLEWHICCPYDLMGNYYLKIMTFI